MFEAVTSPKTESRKKGGGESAHFSILTKSEARRVLGNVTRLCALCCSMDASIVCTLNISDIGYVIFENILNNYLLACGNPSTLVVEFQTIFFSKFGSM